MSCRFVAVAPLWVLSRSDVMSRRVFTRLCTVQYSGVIVQVQMRDEYCPLDTHGTSDVHTFAFWLFAATRNAQHRYKYRGFFHRSNATAIRRIYYIQHNPVVCETHCRFYIIIICFVFYFTLESCRRLSLNAWHRNTPIWPL